MAQQVQPGAATPKTFSLNGSRNLKRDATTPLVGPAGKKATDVASTSAGVASTSANKNANNQTKPAKTMSLQPVKNYKPYLKQCSAALQDLKHRFRDLLHVSASVQKETLPSKVIKCGTNKNARKQVACHRCDDSPATYVQMDLLASAMNKQDPRLQASDDVINYLRDRMVCKNCESKGFCINDAKLADQCMLCRKTYEKTQSETDGDHKHLCTDCGRQKVMQQLNRCLSAVTMMDLHKKTNKIDGNTLTLRWMIRKRTFEFVIHVVVPGPGPEPGPGPGPETETETVTVSGSEEEEAGDETVSDYADDYDEMGNREEVEEAAAQEEEEEEEVPVYRYKGNVTKFEMKLYLHTQDAQYTLPQRMDILRSYVILGMRRHEALPSKNNWVLFCASGLSAGQKDLQHPPSPEDPVRDWEYFVDPIGSMKNRLARGKKIGKVYGFCYLKDVSYQEGVSPYQAEILKSDNVDWPNTLKVKRTR